MLEEVCGRLCFWMYDSKQAKIEYQVLTSELQSLTIPEWKCDHITIHFIDGFPSTKKQHDKIWVIVDWLPKSTYFLTIRFTNLVDELVKIYMDEVFKLHGVLSLFISDRGKSLLLIRGKLLCVIWYQNALEYCFLSLD